MTTGADKSVSYLMVLNKVLLKKSYLVMELASGQLLKNIILAYLHYTDGLKNTVKMI
jgi:hypothetical protein